MGGGLEKLEGEVANSIDCFCPYLSVSVLDCVPLLLFRGNLHI